MSRRSSSKRARRQRSSVVSIVADTTVTSDVIPLTKQLATTEIISEPVEEIIPKVVSSNKKPLTESQELNKLPEYQKGSKLSFYKAFKSASETLVEKDKALAAQAAELSLAYSGKEKAELLMSELTEMDAQKTAALEAKITSLEEHIASLKQGVPQVIPFFGNQRLSYQSDLKLRIDEHNKEWNDLVADAKKVYAELAPKVSNWLHDMKHRIETVEIK